MSTPAAKGGVLNRVVLVGVILLAPWFGYLGSDHSASAARWSFANMLLMLLVSAGVLILALAVLAVTGRALGDRPVTLTVGIGPKVWSMTRGFTTITLRLLPVQTLHTLVTTRKRGQVLRSVLAILASTLFVAGALVLVLWLGAPSWAGMKLALTHRLAPDVLFVLVTAWFVYLHAIWLLGIVLFGTFSDEVLLARRSLGFLAEALALESNGAYERAAAMARRGLEENPDNTLLQVALGSALSNHGDPGAMELATQLMKRELPATQRAVVLNLWAWECYVRGLDEHRLDALSAAAEAASMLPDVPAIHDTYGHVLLWNGNHSKAEQHLRRSYEKRTDAHGRASSAAGLALVCAATDRPDEAQQWLGRAREQGVQLPVIARAIAAVEPLRRI